MTNLERRVRVAAKLREFGHQFVSRELSDEDLAHVDEQVQQLLDLIREAPPRRRSISSENAAGFTMPVPPVDSELDHQLFADSVVSGGANPLGVGASLRRDGDVAVMNVTLGTAFEGAPGRAHGGVVAALIDETMGLVTGIEQVLAFTAQLDITYRAPTPVREPLELRAWLEKRHGRKLTIRATVEARGGVVVEATALFIAVDPTKFLEHVLDS